MIINVVVQARKENHHDVVVIPWSPAARHRCRQPRMLTEVRHLDGWFFDGWDVAWEAAFGHGTRVWFQVQR